MAAGESAYDVARRQREKAARLERSAAMWERGAQGEVEVARALEALPDEWVVLHDLAWPGRQRANIDHVVIGPGGVFVVDAKNWSGRIEVRDEVLMQDGRRREPAVVSAAEAALALQGIVPVSTLCMGVISFVRDESITGWARDVMVCSRANLVAMLTSRPHVLGPDDVRRCVDAVRQSAGERARSTRRAASARQRTTDARTTARRQRRSVRRLVATLALGVLFVGALTGGGLEKASTWVGEQLAEQMAPADPTPTKQLRKDKRKQRKQDQQNQR